MPDINDIYPERSYLTAKDIGEGQILEVKSESLEVRDFTKDGKSIQKLVAKLNNGKMFALNKANAQRLAEWFGTPDYTKWTGRPFKLVRSYTTYAGQEVPCVRVQKPPL